jgi:homoserine trans-succinylase
MIPLKLSTVHDLLSIIGKKPVQIDEEVLYRVAANMYIKKTSQDNVFGKTYSWFLVLV